MIALLLACNAAPLGVDVGRTRGGRVDVFFNEPGSDDENMWADADGVAQMIELVDNAQATIRVAAMGFTYEDLYTAIVRAYDRGVDVQMVGDASHLDDDGYQALFDRHIPLVSGNYAHIMHHKFLVVDERFVVAGTANFTETDFEYNSNNIIVIDSPPVAADFLAEWQQLFDGAFGNNKIEIENGRVYEIGDTTVEVWFSPNEDAMGRVLELADAAEESIRFTIFAFTKDQVGSTFVRKNEIFAEENAAEGIGPDTDYRARRSVAGVVDESQLHSNGQYHEVYRLLAGGVDVRLDGNDNSYLPGDYQAGGGRLHSKTMVLDAYGANPTVISGSFNWSSSATLSNDEFLLVLRGPRVAQLYDGYFESVRDQGRRLGEAFVSDGDVAPGDVVINEIMWYGANSANLDGTDEFIELRNLTDKTFDLDLWTITGAEDVVVGFPVGTVLGPYEELLIVDHVLEPYVDGAPQDEVSAYATGDLVLNSFNDDRQSRLYLKDGNQELYLRDPEATIIDRAGDGGAALVGGPSGGVIRSMERNDEPGDGTDPANWHAFSGTEGGTFVNADFRSEILASPGEPNSAP